MLRLGSRSKIVHKNDDDEIATPRSEAKHTHFQDSDIKSDIIKILSIM